MESKKINQLATELAPDLSDLTIIGDPTTGISKKITLSQMASLFTGTVEEYATLAAFPLVGVADTIYVAKDTNVIYRWDATAYVVLSPNIIASLVFNDANGFDGTIALVGSVATLTITTALTSGSVPFIGASGALTQDNANLFFDDTNNRLGINTNAPTTTLDVFGSGIIGRLNATSTNNAYLGFSSAGTNKWSVGNVQSDHRFRIFSEANSAELISVLQTGEFGIGIANPTTKFHIDGASSALIANLDANVSVAKSISFRSDNSNRINLEVSGTESGSNAGANFLIRAYSDAGALLNTPLTITRSTGNATFIGDVQLNGASGNRKLTIQSNTSGDAILEILAAGSNGGSVTYKRSTSELILNNNAVDALKITGSGSAIFSNFIGVNGSPATSFPLEAYINSSTVYSSTSRGNIMRVYNSNTSANIFAGIELGGAGTANDGLAGLNAVVTGSGSAALTFYTRNGGTFSEKLRISGNGYVGIATSSPITTFQIRNNHWQQYIEKSITSQTNFISVNLKNNGAAIMSVTSSAFRPGVDTYGQTIQYFLVCRGEVLTVATSNNNGQGIVFFSVSGSTITLAFGYAGGGTNFQNAYVSLQGVSQNGFEESITVTLL